MKRALMMVLLLGACSGRDNTTEPQIDPCPDGCPNGKIALVSHEIVWKSAEHVIYSGDTLDLRISIRNSGSGRSDTARVGVLFSRNYDGYSSATVPPLDAGQSATVTLRVHMALIYAARADADRYHVSVFRSGNTDVGVFSDSIPFKPTYMLLSGPSSLRAGQDYDLQLQIINPSPHHVLPASLGACFAKYNCVTPVFTRVLGPDVAPASTATLSLRVRVPVPEEVALPATGNLSVCYGAVGVSTECGWFAATLNP